MSRERGETHRENGEFGAGESLRTLVLDHEKAEES
jgi:hypothetical protein